MAIKNDANRRAVAKYKKENYDQILLRVAKGQKDVIQGYARKLTLQIQKSLMIRKMYTKMVRIPVLHRDLEVRSPYRSHLQMMRSQIFR